MAASNKYKCTQTHSKFIWYVLLTYIKYISYNTLLVILFIYLILFKKKEKKGVKPGHLQQIKKIKFKFSIHPHGRFQQIQMYPNTLKIHMVCVTYIQQIYVIQHSFSYFIYLSYFV